jgi:sugar lactone lactonase YvrE
VPYGYAVYFTERAKNRVVRWEPDSGDVDVVAGEPADRDPSQSLNDPYGLAFDPDGNLLIADKLNDRICRLVMGRLEARSLVDVSGHRASLPTSPQGYNSALRTPTGLFTEPDGGLLCSFTDDYTIYRIGAKDELKLVLGLTRNRGYSFTKPRETVPPLEVGGTPLGAPTVVVERMDGTIYFIERMWQFVREYHPKRGLTCLFPVSRQLRWSKQLLEGPPKARMAEYHPAYPSSLALDREENLYLSDVWHGCVLRLNTVQGEVVRVLQLPRVKGMEERGPSAVTFGSDGTAWVFDGVAGVIEAYSPGRQGAWKSRGVRLAKVRGEPIQVPMAGAGLVTR